MAALAEIMKPAQRFMTREEAKCVAPLLIEKADASLARKPFVKPGEFMPNVLGGLFLPKQLGDLVAGADPGRPVLTLFLPAIYEPYLSELVALPPQVMNLPTADLLHLIPAYGWVMPIEVAVEKVPDFYVPHEDMVKTFEHEDTPSEDDMDEPRFWASVVMLSGESVAVGGFMVDAATHWRGNHVISEVWNYRPYRYFSLEELTVAKEKASRLPYPCEEWPNVAAISDFCEQPSA
ncbi:MAG: hypothetical protein EG824_01060 [Deltaproteobacteria bacterium]|nr:hypothetical protein [Deltaproteobacteria bacterium]